MAKLVYKDSKASALSIAVFSMLAAVAQHQILHHRLRKARLSGKVSREEAYCSQTPFTAHPLSHGCFYPDPTKAQLWLSCTARCIATNPIRLWPPPPLDSNRPSSPEASSGSKSLQIEKSQRHNGGNGCSSDHAQPALVQRMFCLMHTCTA